MLNSILDPNDAAVFDEAPFFGDMVDPHGLFRVLVERGGFVQEGKPRELAGLGSDPTLDPDAPGFLVMGYDEAREVLSDPLTFSNETYRGLRTTFGHNLLTMDPPEHTRYRRVMQKALLPQTIAGWASRYIEPVIDGLLDEIAGTGSCDLLTAFIKPYPFDVIYRQLELPPEMTEQLRFLSSAVKSFQTKPEQAVSAGEELRVFYEMIVRERRNGAGQDLVSLIARAEVDGERLPEEIVVNFFRMLQSAAGDTTYRATATMMIGLLRDRPDQLEMVRADRSLVNRAIDEALRWDGPQFQASRWAMRDTTVGGVDIPAGAIAYVMTGMANRDPRRFPDPDRFDIMRPNLGQHLGFLAGPHICVGMHVARLEMTRALNAMLDRLPNLRLDPDYPPPAARGSVLRWTDHLFVRFD